MSRGSGKRVPGAASRPAVMLAFGEDANDTAAIRELVKALRPDLPPVAPQRAPIVLAMGGIDKAKERKNVAGMVELAKAMRVTHEVRAIFAHRDCDAVEPAHEGQTAAIETRLAEELARAGLTGCCCVAVTPASMMEAWWFLWPQAVAAVNRNWKALPARPGNVGAMPHAKTELIRQTRNGKSCYQESDGPRIAAKVRELGLISQPVGTSASFGFFRERVLALRAG